MAGTRRVLDCGAGIGRVSKRLLLPLFSEVDLLEQNPTFLEKAKTYLVSSIDLALKDIPFKGQTDVSLWRFHCQKI